MTAEKSSCESCGRVVRAETLKFRVFPREIGLQPKEPYRYKVRMCRRCRRQLAYSDSTREGVSEEALRAPGKVGLKIPAG